MADDDGHDNDGGFISSLERANEERAAGGEHEDRGIVASAYHLAKVGLV